MTPEARARYTATQREKRRRLREPKERGTALAKRMDAQARATLPAMRKAASEPTFRCASPLVSL